MKLSLNYTLFLLIPISFGLGFLGPACSPEDDAKAGLAMEVGPDGRLRTIEIKGQSKATCGYNDKNELNEITWESGEQYSCSSTGTKTNSIQLNAGYELRCTYNNEGNMTQYVDDQDFFKSTCDISYENGYPTEMHSFSSTKKQDGTYEDAEVWDVYDISADKYGMHSATVCVHNGSSQCFQEFEVAITCIDLINPFINDAMYTCLQEFNDFAYNISKFSEYCVSKMEFTNTTTLDVHTVTLNWKTDQSDVVTGVEMETPNGKTESFFKWW